MEKYLFDSNEIKEYTYIIFGLTYWYELMTKRSKTNKKLPHEVTIHATSIVYIIIT